MALTLIGLGMDKDDVTKKAESAIKNAEIVILKTNLNDGFSFFAENGIETVSLDYLYEKSRNFDTLTQNVVKEIKTLSKGKEAVYCVEGSVFEDNACNEIISKFPGTKVISGVSKATSALEKIGVKSGYTALSAYDIDELKYFDGVVCVYDVDSQALAGEVKLKLAELYGDECPAVVFSHDSYKKMPLYECDREEKYDYATRIVVLKQDFLHKETYGFYDLVKIVKMLRGENGCPWDKAQTHESIRTNAIEETYELIDAIDRRDDERMLEELGDVMLQTVFHTIMAEERGALTETEVTTAICKKLISRHTHIFFGEKAETASQALDVWEKNKLKEHNHTPAASVGDVAECFPALMRCQKIQKRAEKAGYPFNEAASEAAELADLLLQLSKDENMLKTFDKGDLLFKTVNLVRKAGGDSEMDLYDASSEFKHKFLKEHGLEK